jgi:subtilisin family serine protease
MHSRVPVLLIAAILILSAGCIEDHAGKKLPGSKTCSPQAVQKISTELRMLLDPGLLPPSQTPAKYHDFLVRKNILIPAGSAARQLGLTGPDPSNVQDQVTVYIFLYPGAKAPAVDPYITRVINRKDQYDVIVAWVGVDRLADLAQLGEVRLIRPIEPPEFSSGATVTEGDRILWAEAARLRYPGMDGTGIKIGVLSKGIDHWEISRDTGDILADLHILQKAGGGDEGTAMLEIVHDLAPGSDLYFHDSGSDVYTFMDAIENLTHAGCQVIVDDIAWKYQPAFEEGDLAKYLEGLSRNDRMIYVTAAGNNADHHYQGTFSDDGHGFHNFGAQKNSSLPIRFFGFGDATIVLHWDDRTTASARNLDLFLYRADTMELLAYSNNTQNGTQDPLEVLIYENDGKIPVDTLLRIGMQDPSSRESVSPELHLFMYGSGFFPDRDLMHSNGSVIGHQAAAGIITVGAVGSDSIGTPEFFSSRGPVRIAYPNPDLRSKPEICGISGVMVSGAGGFPAVMPGRFTGTSAAAPHIAGIAASVWGAYPDLKASQIRDLLYASADPIADANACGHGRANETAMVEMIQRVTS